MSNEGPIVPTNKWKAGLQEAYAPELDAFRKAGYPVGNISTQNDGSIYVETERTGDPDAAQAQIDALEAAGFMVLSTLQTKRGWHVVTPAGMEYAQTHHPSEGRAAPKSSGGRELSPEEQARREKARQVREQLEAIRAAQKEETPDEYGDDVTADEEGDDTDA